MTLLDAAHDDPEAVLTVKGTHQIAVCIPARDEADTIADVVATAVALCEIGLVDDLVVVDDGSTDGTAVVARAEGATVVPSLGGPGKGQALTTAVAATDADVLVFLDADVTNVAVPFVTRLVTPLLTRPDLQLVKGSYRRPCRGRPDEGGRVTELLARPLLRRFFPELADLLQPLAGESAFRRSALEGVELADGYGIEIALLIDTWRRYVPRAAGPPQPPAAPAESPRRRHRRCRARSGRPRSTNMTSRTIAIVGASLAGAKAAEAARQAGFDGRVVLIGDEDRAPAPLQGHPSR